MKTPAFQLCSYYLDGNDEAAFEVFEYGGPPALREFFGFRGSEVAWRQIYRVLLDEYGFLDRLCQKYQMYMSNLIRERGIETFREALHLEDDLFDTVVVRVWEKLLDLMLDQTMQHNFHERKKSHFGMFFTGLRNLLRKEIGF